MIDRAMTELEVKVLRQASKTFSIDQSMQLLQLELLLGIFDSLDKMTGMLDSIDDRLTDIEKHADSSQHLLNGIQDLVGRVQDPS